MTGTSEFKIASDHDDPHLSEPAAAVLAWLTDQHDAPVSHRAVHQRFKDRRWAHTTTDITRVMRELEDLGYVREQRRVPTGGIGRPSVVWELTSHGHAHAAHIKATALRHACLRSLSQLTHDLQALSDDTRAELQTALDEIAAALDARP